MLGNPRISHCLENSLNIAVVTISRIKLSLFKDVIW